MSAETQVQAGMQPSDRRRTAPCPSTIRPKRVVFWVVFALVFCLSGLLTVLALWLGFPYRMGLVSALVIPLIVLYGIRITPVTLCYAGLAAVVVLSGVWNGSSLLDIALFMRILGFSYLTYTMVDLYLRPNNAARVIRMCVLVAIVQLPSMIVQRLTYPYLPASVRANVGIVDAAYGTFNFKGDAPMTFFLTLIVIFLLFDRRRNYIIRHRWFVSLWLTLTVLVANAELVKLILACVWVVYLVRYLSVRTIIFGTSALLIVVVVLASLGLLGEVWARFSYNLVTNARIDAGREEVFLSGSYARGAAVAYYVSRGVRLLGDGPSRYYNPFTRERIVGNTGHIFTFYSEVGLLGWLTSVLVFFAIAFPMRNGRIRVHWVSILMFAGIQLLSFTTEIMNDISVVLMYCIFARSYLVKPATR